VKLAIVNLGCPKNQVDLETIIGGLRDQVELVDGFDQADAVIVNTCAFIDPAKKESIDAVFDVVAAKRENNSLKLVVTGCLPQRYKELAELLPEVDYFSYSNRTDNIVDDVLQYFNFEPASSLRHLLNPRHYAYLRLAEGCNNRCTYCAIPLIKGDYSSRPLNEILKEAKQLADSGVKELILIAQDTTYYGRDLTVNINLAHVLEELNRIDPIQWIRLLYTHPAHWNNALVEAVNRYDKIVPYIDMPIQHISNPVLKRMGRRVRRHDIEKLIKTFRRRIPDVALRTSIICGFPGETDQDHAELMAFLSEIKFEKLGVFTYSHEEGTPSFQWDDDVPDELKRDRQQEIINQQEDIAHERSQSLIGKQLKVIIDECNRDTHVALARSVWEAPEIDGNIYIHEPVIEGEFYSVSITDADFYDLSAKVIQ